MMKRTTRRTVVFARPFVLAALDGAQPPGAYVVETDEELLQEISFPAWRRSATVIQLHPNPGLSLSVTVDPQELEDALRQDDARSGTPRDSTVL